MNWNRTLCYLLWYETYQQEYSAVCSTQLCILNNFLSSNINESFPKEKKYFCGKHLYFVLFFSPFTFYIFGSRKKCKKELLRPKKTFSLAVTFNYFNLFFFEIRNIIYALNGLMWRQQIHWKKNQWNVFILRSFAIFIFAIHLNGIYSHFW